MQKQKRLDQNNTGLCYLLPQYFPDFDQLQEKNRPLCKDKVIQWLSACTHHVPGVASAQRRPIHEAHSQSNVYPCYIC